MQQFRRYSRRCEQRLWWGTGFYWCAVAHNAPKPLRNGIPGYPTPNGIALLSSFFLTPAPSHYTPFYLLLFYLLTSQLGSAADRSLGFSLLGQNGGGGLWLNEGSPDRTTGSASMKRRPDLLRLLTSVCRKPLNPCEDLSICSPLIPQRRAQP